MWVRRKLLLIDEQPGIQPLRLSLEQSGFFVTNCQRIEQVCSACKSTVYDLVLIDIDTLQTCWIDLVEMLIEGIDVTAPIVILTHNMTIERLSETLRSGVSDFILKPFTQTALIDFINRQIAKSKRRAVDYDLTHSLRHTNHSYIFQPPDYFQHSIVQYLFSDIQKCLHMHPLKRSEIYLVLEEAISNAFYHGIWQLTKDETHLDRDTLIRLTNQKNNEATTERFVRVDIAIDKQNGHLHIKVKDTGNGFDHSEYLKNLQNDMFKLSISGRGLLLIQTLSKEMTFDDKGAMIKIVVEVG